MIDAALISLLIVSFVTAVWFWDTGKAKENRLGINEDDEDYRDSTMDESGIRLGKDPLEKLLTHPSLTSRTVRYEGKGRLPRKVYEGDSKNVIFDLNPTLHSLRGMHEPFLFFKNTISKTEEGLAITVQATHNDNASEYLEFELVAAGFTVEGDKKQKQALGSNNLHYQWNCYFPNSGNHIFFLVVRVIGSQNVIEVGRIEQAVRVVKFDHMTQRQVWIVATSAGVISGGLAIAEILHRLNLW